jgi:hypothetical protein
MSDTVVGALMALAGTAFVTVIATGISWWNSDSQREWQKEKWSREHRETVYSNCLKYLSVSRSVPEESNGGN